MKNNVLSPDAEKIAQEFREFAYIVSHDLNAPVRGMVAFSRLLKEEQFDSLGDEGKLYLSLIIESGEKLQNLLAGLLDYSRLNTTGEPFSLVDCNGILSDCRIALKNEIDNCIGKIEVASLPSIMADAAQLRQLFLILLDNALKFHVAEKTPQIWVSAENSGKDWVFTVRDNGIGIEPEFHERIFQPLQKLHADSVYPGTGMGLALAKKIIDRHGGRIWIDSVYGQGASFIFSMPHIALD